MARFIKADKPSGREPDSSPTETFDFAAIARDLGAEDGPSTFDSLLSKPVETNAETAPEVSAEVPPLEKTPLQENPLAEIPVSEDEVTKTPTPETKTLEIESSQGETLVAQTVPSGETREFDEFEALFQTPGDTPEPPPNAASQPPVSVEAKSEPALVSQPQPPVLTVPVMTETSVTPALETEIPSTPEAPPVIASEPVAIANGGAAKKSPLLFAGVGALLVVLAVGAFMMNRPQPEESLQLPTAPSMSLPPREADVSKPSAPKTPKAQKATPAKVATPVKKAPAPMKPLTPQLKAELKMLWNKGRVAKAAKDYAGAKNYWQQALKLRPGHPGFQDSIDKLPPQP